jgi:hypothetical protein
VKRIKSQELIYICYPRLFIKFLCLHTGNRIFPLIPPNAFGASEVFASHPPFYSPLDKGGIKRGYLTIGKEISSNTLSPAIAFNFTNNIGMSSEACKRLEKCSRIINGHVHSTQQDPRSCRCSSEAEQLIRNQLVGSSTLPTGSNLEWAEVSI